MNVVFRTDASTIIGSGHVSRCAALGTQLKAAGSQVSFVCRRQSGDLRGWLRDRGFRVSTLADGPLGSDGQDDWRQDARATAQQIDRIPDQSGCVDWLVVDHYGIDVRWERQMRGSAQRLLVIDDLADRPHDCDLLLDQNYAPDGSTRYRGLVPEHCNVLLGPQYALLRDEFVRARARAGVRGGEIKRILVFFGGGDATNQTQKSIAALRKLRSLDIDVDIVIGAANPYRRDIENGLSDLPNIRCHVDTSEMARLIAEADLALGAGGTATWERFCLGLPSIVVSVATNQEAGIRNLAEEGRLLYVGRAEEVSVERIALTVQALCGNPHWCRFLSRSGMDLVDGRGAKRVVRAMTQGSVTVRPAAPADRDRIYAWRNADITRRYALNRSVIERTEHEGWFDETLRNPAKVLLIGESAGEAIGVLRYDTEQEEATISVYLVPDHHGQGYGVPLLEAGSRWLQANRPAVHTLRALVLSENKKGKKAFSLAGFEQHLAVFTKKLP